MIVSVAPYGVYIHIPFCAKRCDYCAFATWTDRGHLVDRYLAVLAAEIRRAALPPVTSVFVGGGTPTSVPPEALGAVVDAVPVVAGAEITVECNPDDVTAEMMRTFRDHGVNRVSIGVQSMVDEVLASLGRTHVPANVERAVDAVRAAGMPSFNIDLIYGAPGESMGDWRTSIEQAIELEPDHISAYALIVEDGPAFAR